jgi:hypothetical protein
MFILRLRSGRHHPDERLDDWGLSGPSVGPVEFVHLDHHGLSVELPNGRHCELPMIDGLVFYGGLFYAELELVSPDDPRLAFEPPVEPFDPHDAQVPRWAWKLQREARGVKLKKADLPAFRDAVAVFCDRVTEIAGERSATAARRALANVLIDYVGRSAVDPELARAGALQPF